MTLQLCKYFHCGTRNLIDITEREMEFAGSKPAPCEARSRGMAGLVESSSASRAKRARSIGQTRLYPRDIMLNLEIKIMSGRLRGTASEASVASCFPLRS